MGAILEKDIFNFLLVWMGTSDFPTRKKNGENMERKHVRSLHWRKVDLLGTGRGVANFNTLFRSSFYYVH